MTDPIERYRLISNCWSRDLPITQCFTIAIEHGHIVTTQLIQRIYYLEEAGYRHYLKEQKEECRPDATDNHTNNLGVKHA